MQSVAVVVLALVAAASAGVVGPAFAPTPLGYVHGGLPYHGYGLQVAPAFAAPVAKVAAPIAYAHHAYPAYAPAYAPYAAPYAHPVHYAAPIAPVVKTAAVAYTAPLLARAAVVHPAPLLAKPAFAAPVAYGAYGHYL